MENSNYEIYQPQETQAELAKSFIAKVFSWMAAALIVSGFTAYLFGNSGLISYLIDTTTGHRTLMGTVVMFAPLGFVLAMGLGFNKFSSAVMVLLFMVYSILTGMSLSFIFLFYTSSSIFSVFGIAGMMFGVMAIAGYTTKTDLTSFGSLLYMALVGLIIASVINWFMHSSSMSYIISFVGVLIFTGLTAYDVQKLKRIGTGVDYNGEVTAKLSILGALTLYLDFINIFLFLLQIFGKRK